MRVCLCVGLSLREQEGAECQTPGTELASVSASEGYFLGMRPCIVSVHVAVMCLCLVCVSLPACPVSLQVGMCVSAAP